MSAQSTATTVRIAYFSDVLCVWAYVGQARLDELRRKLGDRIELIYRQIQVFGDVPDKMARSWGHRGGPEAYRDHVLQVAAGFPHVQVHPEIWTRNVPKSSLPAHMLLKAAQVLVDEGACPAGPIDTFDGMTVLEQTAWQIRRAFFEELVDVGQRGALLEIAENAGLPRQELEAALDDGRAAAALWGDQARREHHQVQGSPTFVLNQGRQKLFGNVGYRVIAANIEELLHDNAGQLSWC